MSAFSNLKKLFKDNVISYNDGEGVIVTDESGQTYDDWGFDMAKKHHGNANAFQSCWALVKEHYVKTERNNTTKQDEDIQKSKAEIEKIGVKKRQAERTIEYIKQKIDDITQEIEKLRKDIFRIKENPKSVLDKDKASNLNFIIGLIILIGLSLYLFAFYSSASYSAFFKDFTPNDNKIATAIFDAQAVPNAWKDGFMEFIFIMCIPLVFMGLGFLIHKFQQIKSKIATLKIITLVVITFIFDFILAYGITREIYKIERMADPEGIMPPYSVSLAFENIHFWIIIFAGFVVYLVWGFVFDFTMETYEKLNSVKSFIKSKESEITHLQGNIKEKQTEIDEQKKLIHQLELEEMPHLEIVNGNKVMMNWSRFYVCVGEFTNGWAQWMTANKFEKHFIDEIHNINIHLTREHKGKKQPVMQLS